MSSQPMKIEYSEKNTFIQFEAPRSESLEEFLQPRSAFSCPASRMVSLEEDPRETAEVILSNDSLVQWPATRGPSLEEEEEAAKFAIEVNASLESALSVALATPEVPTLSQAPPPRWASIEDDEELPEFMKTITKEQDVSVTAHPAQTFEWPATRGPSLDEFAGAPILDVHGAPMVLNLETLATPSVAPPVAPPLASPEIFLNLEALAAPPVVPEMFMQSTAMDDFMKAKSYSKQASDASTTVSTDEDHILTTPPSGLSDDEGEAQKEQYEDQSATLKISLTDTLGLWSIGSADHESGECKPCAFLWKDLSKPGCQNGSACVFCHLCPPGEVKKRKKQKMFMRKLAKNLQYMDPYAMNQTGFEPQFEPQYQNQFPAGHGMW